jgi:predicted MPP superfamily phosphohydrolase
MPHRRLKHKIDFPALKKAAREGTPGLELSSSGRGPWMQFREPAGCVWKVARIPIRGLPTAMEGVRILHVSDLHLRPFWTRAYDEILARIRQSPPDVILFTGDFINDKYDHRPSLPFVRRFVHGLVARHGVYGILGNHDPDVLAAHVAAAGVRIVTDRQVIAPVGIGNLEIIGLPGPSRYDLDIGFLNCLAARRSGTPRIVLCHYPDLFCATMKLDPDLYLAGHTHGGQVCLPSGRALLTHDSMPRRFAKGIHRIGETWYAVSNGLGFTGLPIRIFCPAEVVEFVLKPDRNEEG